MRSRRFATGRRLCQAWRLARVARADRRGGGGGVCVATRRLRCGQGKVPLHCNGQLATRRHCKNSPRDANQPIGKAQAIPGKNFWRGPKERKFARSAKKLSILPQQFHSAFLAFFLPKQIQRPFLVPNNKFAKFASFSNILLTNSLKITQKRPIFPVYAFKMPCGNLLKYLLQKSHLNFPTFRGGPVPSAPLDPPLRTGCRCVHVHRLTAFKARAKS